MPTRTSTNLLFLSALRTFPVFKHKVNPPCRARTSDLCTKTNAETHTMRTNVHTQHQSSGGLNDEISAHQRAPACTVLPVSMATALMRWAGKKWVLWSYVRAFTQTSACRNTERKLSRKRGGGGGCCSITKGIRTAPNPPPNTLHVLHPQHNNMWSVSSNMCLLEMRRPSISC